MAFGFGDILGGLAFPFLGAAAGMYNSEQNRKLQAQAQDYNRWAQDVTWNREDRAVQRRTADLKAAGLSPVLAAGSGASTGSPIKIDPVQNEDATGIGKMMEMMQARNQYAMTASNLQTAEANRDLMKAQEENTKAKTGILGKEFGLYGNVGGHPKYQDVWGKRITSLIDGMTKMRKSVKLPTTPEEKRAVLDANRPSGVPFVTEQQMKYLFE